MANDQGNDDAKGKADVQGEGDYKAARRYNESAREFVKDNDVTEAARDAEPANAREEQQLEHAEQQGRDRAKDEDPLLDRPEDISKDGDKDARK